MVERIALICCILFLVLGVVLMVLGVAISNPLWYFGGLAVLIVVVNTVPRLF